MTVVGFLLSLVTWVPGLLIFFFQASLAGFGWLMGECVDDRCDLLSDPWSGSLLLSLLSLAVSSVVKWRVVASGALLGIVLCAKCVRRDRESALSNASRH